jgi:hypothetical protein
METIENKVADCTWKIMALDKTSTTFEKVKKDHKLYNCVDCPGHKEVAQIMLVIIDLGVNMRTEIINNASLGGKDGR